MNDSKIVIDLDGTICPIKSGSQSYMDLVPNSDVIRKLNELHELGFEICIYTSRNMRTYKGNIGLINANTLPDIISWLNKWKVPFDEIIVGKPWPGNKGFYVDDRAIRPNEFIKFNLNEILKLLEAD